MIFSSNIFLFLFLPAVLATYLFSPKNLRNYILLIASLFFYAWGEMQYIFVLLISIFANYFFGIAIGNHQKNQVNQGFGIHKIKFILFIAIASNLLLLGYFKYANFLANNLNDALALFFADLKITLGPVHLPIGISFFTFHSISYVVDIYRGKVRPQKNIFDLALYISLFPQLVAGPIVRYNTINKQLDVKKRRHHPLFVAYGIRRFIIGLAKKVIIANPLGEIADHIFALPADQISFSLAWIGVVCYSLQIFFDFSGYSDMAIGIARIFGFKFLENFNYPYISRSIKEFWRRWHISLSSWFRDYLYIPLGGNRCSLYRQYFNLVLVFFLCGFWHGSSWNFIIWGLFHGFFLVLERTKFGEFIEGEKIWQKIISHIYALSVLMVGWVFFRSSNLPYAIAYLKAMFINFDFFQTIPGDINILIFSNFNWLVFAIAVLISTPVFACFKFTKNNSLLNYGRDIWLIFILIASILRLAAGTHNPFIYFQF